jgi:hypothetical protein
MAFLASSAGYNPLRFDQMAYVLTTKKNVLVQAGVLVPSPKMDSIMSNGGVIFDMPFWNDVANTDDRVSAETPIPNLFSGGSFYPAPEALTSAKEVGVRLCRNQSWGAMDLADTIMLDGDPMSFVASRFSVYQSWQLQKIFLAIWAGIFADNDAAPSGTEHVLGDLTLDISNAAGSGVFAPGVTTFGASAHIRATQLLGDSKGDLAVALMHSVVEASIALQDLVETIRDSQGNIQFKTFMGMRIVIDDDMTSPSSGVYDTYYFGLGAMVMGRSMPKVPYALERYEGAGNGAGAAVEYHRWEWCVHPVGHKWTVASTGGGPTNAATTGNLADVASWQRVYPERKQIKVVRVRSREF